MKSNCLIQALKHRLKGCPIYQVLRQDRDGRIHFVWWCAELSSYRHFTWEKEIKLPKFPYFTTFEGHIENFPYDKTKFSLKLVF